MEFLHIQLFKFIFLQHVLLKRQKYGKKIKWSHKKSTVMKANQQYSEIFNGLAKLFFFLIAAQFGGLFLHTLLLLIFY